jgi:hypothetical protein
MPFSKNANVSTLLKLKEKYCIKNNICLIISFSFLKLFCAFQEMQ